MYIQFLYWKCPRCGNFEYKVHNIRKDNLGNYIIVDITIEGERMTLANIYGPNTDNDIFFIKLFLTVSKNSKMKNIYFVEISIWYKTKIKILNTINM